MSIIFQTFKGPYPHSFPKRSHKVPSVVSFEQSNVTTKSKGKQEFHFLMRDANVIYGWNFLPYKPPVSFIHSFSFRWEGDNTCDTFILFFNWCHLHSNQQPTTNSTDRPVKPTNQNKNILSHEKKKFFWSLILRLFAFFFPSFLLWFTQHSLSINLVTSLAANNYQLQCDLIRNGVLWSILLFMFDYDYTLEESGVEIEEKSNKQVRTWG